jgi:hypothetical protein
MLEPVGRALLGLGRTQRPAAHFARLAGEVRFLGAVGMAVALAALLARRGGAALRDVQAVEPERAARRVSPLLGRPIHESDRARRAMAAACAVALALTLLPVALDPALRACRAPDPAVRLGRPVGKWLRAHVTAGTLVATNCAGSLPYFSELPVIDMLGLTDAHIARSRPDRSQWIGHEKGDGTYVLGRRPDLLIFGGPEGSETPWSFPGDRQIASAAAFRAGYELVRVPLAGFEFIFYLRRGAPRPGPG